MCLHCKFISVGCYYGRKILYKVLNKLKDDEIGIHKFTSKVCFWKFLTQNIKEDAQDFSSKPLDIRLFFGRTK